MGDGGDEHPTLLLDLGLLLERAVQLDGHGVEGGGDLIDLRYARAGKSNAQVSVGHLSRGLAQRAQRPQEQPTEDERHDRGNAADGQRGAKYAGDRIVATERRVDLSGEPRGGPFDLDEAKRSEENTSEPQ